MLNRVILVGRLTRDPELRRTNTNDTPVATFTIAVDNKMKNPDGTRGTTFLNCVVWNQQADNVAKFCRKGNLVGVDGSLVQRNYDRKDGTKATVIEVRCDSVTFLEPKGSKEAADAINFNEINQTEPEDNSKNLESIDVVDDDLPF